MKVRLSGAARHYIRTEARYLRDRNRAAAVAFVARMAEAQRLLTQFPEIGAERDGLPVKGLRRLIVGDLLDYEAYPDGLIVVSIRHGAQRPAAPNPGDDFDYEV